MRTNLAAKLVLLTLLALIAGWFLAPGGDPLGWKGGFGIRRGLDLQGGLQVLLEARPPAGQPVDAATLAGTRDTIERRVNALGVSEPVIQTRGSDQIVVELPGVRDPDEAVRILRQTALLEIVAVGAAPPAVGATVATSLGAPAPSAAATPRGLATPGAATPAAGAAAAVGPTYETIVSGRDLADAFPATGQTGQAVVGFRLQDAAADRFYAFTSAHQGEYLAVVVDKRVVNAARVNGAIRSQGVIEGLPPAEVNALILQLKSGALAVPLEVVQSRTVGPTLGSESVRQSVRAGLVGLALVALFMLGYYRLPGLLADVALLLYALFALALFKLLGVVLTLAGIAGFILSIGMAVDANVLIFARLKEELRGGRALPAAVATAFQQAWPSIRDSNASTMITCAILYWFGRYVGASIIQGFALTLFLGVAVSMFTALTATRALLEAVVPRARHPRWIGATTAPTDAAGNTAGGTADGTAKGAA